MKKIFITGASSGFGYLTTALLLKNGHSVIAGIRGGHARWEKVLQNNDSHPNINAKEQIQEGLKTGQLSTVDLHVDREDSILSVKAHVEERFEGKLDVLINNAGFGLMGPLEEQTMKELRMQIEVNFFGPVSLFQTLLDPLKAAKGRIINVSSVAGRIAFPFYGAYCASKFALEGYSESLWHEMKRHGVSVCLLEPGGFKTKFSSSLQYSSGAKDTDSPTYQAVQNFDQQIMRKAMKIAGDPYDAAKTLVKLTEKKSVPLRVIIGSDGWLAWIFWRILPNSIFNWIINFSFRTFIFRGA